MLICSVQNLIKGELTGFEFLTDIDLVIADSDVDEEYGGSRLFRKIKSKKKPIMTSPEQEVTVLKNRVQFLENEVRLLHQLINRFISGNDNSSI